LCHIQTHSGGSDRRLKWLQKIARAAGICLVGVKYRQAFADCSTPQQKEKKLREMLKDAGMHGTAADAAAVAPTCSDSCVV